MNNTKFRIWMQDLMIFALLTPVALFFVIMLYSTAYWIFNSIPG